jgi:hypothetical protein
LKIEIRLANAKFCSMDGFVRYTISLDGIRPIAGDSKENNSY